MSLRAEIEDLIPTIESSPYIDDWPPDEQELYRNSPPEIGNIERKIMMDAYRRIKVADAIMKLLVAQDAPG